MPVTSLPVDQLIMTKFASSTCETSDFDPNGGNRLVSGLSNMSRCLPSYLKFCYSFKELKLSVPLSNSEHTPLTANTDNKGHLFVTVFELLGSLKRDPQITPPGRRTSAHNKTPVS
jgi:hypothetical protein